MLRNAKRKGSKNERRSMALMEAAGYSCTKAGASLGVFDVIAVGSNDFVLLQVKSNRWPSAAEMETIKNFICPHNAKKLVHRWVDRKRLPDVREV